MSRINRSMPALTALLSLFALTLLRGTSRVHADDVPVIDITAKRFAFSPDRITLKKGQTVKLRLHSEDVTHGFFLRPLKLDEEIPAGATTEVIVTPQQAGTFTTICDHFCGAKHGNMNMTIKVEE
ncbi:MAG TPA: cupredoxin domain-containing protein [Candidatus Sulfotelmatobacter sp.]|nr:cupredoxin domain-containing protein [Candidatus Sulfotelmatobacter sp.]